VAAAPRSIRGGRYFCPSQGHMYMEPQSAIAEPDEDGALNLTVSTQCYDMVQEAVARVMGLPHNKVQVRVRRLGGAFGGKVTHTCRVAAAAAVAAQATGCQVRLALNRNTDMALCGGRPEYDVTYDVGFDDQGRLLAVDIKCVLLGGAYADMTFVDIWGAAGAADNVYAVPAFRAQWSIARANLPPRTTVRGPGDLEAICIMENIIEHVAAECGLPPHVVRERNFQVPAEGSEVLLSSTGKAVRAAQYTVPRIWKEVQAVADFEARLAAVEAHNAAHPWRKRGLSLVPAGYHVGMGKRGAIVHVYLDGSVLVVHPGCDMGQGLITKVLQTACYELSKAVPESQRPLPLSLFRATDGSTHALPHNSLTGGSTTTEMACEAVRLACADLVKRIREHAAHLGDSYTWQQALSGLGSLFMGFKTPLTAHAHGGLGDLVPPLASPPPAPLMGYAVYGAAVVEAEVDVLTGDRRILAADIVFDVGRSINPAIDMGQIEGAFVYGLGALVNEHVEHDPETGACTTASTWSYKVPGAACVPERMSVHMLKDSPLLVQGPVSAKACQEPPLLLASAALLALQAAARAAAVQTFGAPPDAPYVPLAAPATVEAIKALCGTTPLAQVLHHVGSK